MLSAVNLTKRAPNPALIRALTAADDGTVPV